MRKITHDATDAFIHGIDFRRDNTEVAPTDRSIALYLHGNRIARGDMETGKITLTLAGWPTVTTRERLNGLLSRITPYLSIYQSGGEQYLYDQRTRTKTKIGAHDKIHLHNGHVTITTL